jgi:hypothetical protein
MFVFTSARVSNDAAVAAFSSLTTWGAVRLTVRGLSWRGLALTGTALGLAILSKLSGVVLAPVLALALLFDSLRIWRGRWGMDTIPGVADLLTSRSRGETDHSQCHPVMHVGKRFSLVITHWSLVVLPALAVSGWWFARNLLLYDELMGVEAWLSHTSTVRPEPIGLLQVIPELAGLEKSYWAMFGWFNIAAAPWMYRVWWVLVRLAVVGLGLALVDQWNARRLAPAVRGGLLVVTAAFLANLGSVWRFIMIVLGAQGRYLMPSVASISLLLMLGLSRVLPKSFALHRRGSVLAGTVGVVHLALTLISLLMFILPAYARPVVLEESDLPPDMTRLRVSFDGTPIRLLGGHIEVDSTQPGVSVPVSLYWQAVEPPRQDYITFVQILGRDMDPIAGVDCYPGRGNFPPTLWQPGVIYRDRYDLPIAADAKVPTAAALHVGLYDETRKRMMTSSLPGQLPLELVMLDVVAVRPCEPLSDDVDYPVRAAFGKAITLVGYDLSTNKVSPGDTITVTLVWRARGPIGTEYTAFVHLVDANGDLLTQSDHPPMGGAYPTSLWDSGDVVHDRHRLKLDHAAASGGSKLSIGMYNSKTLERLPAYSEQGGERFEDDVIVGRGVTIE